MRKDLVRAIQESRANGEDILYVDQNLHTVYLSRQFMESRTLSIQLR